MHLLTDTKAPLQHLLTDVNVNGAKGPLLLMTYSALWRNDTSYSESDWTSKMAAALGSDKMATCIFWIGIS